VSFFRETNSVASGFQAHTRSRASDSL